MTSTSAPLIELSGITKSYREGERERVVFRDASLSVGRGEWVFLLGRSGSGKSTLLNLISGIDLPEQGLVTVDGMPINRLSERNRTLFRRGTGSARLPVRMIFIPTLTVEENILLPLELAGDLTTASRASARELLEQVGLADRGGSYPDRLSGGGSSGLPWHAPWSTGRHWSSPMSRPATSTVKPDARCSTSSSAWSARPARPWCSSPTAVR